MTDRATQVTQPKKGEPVEISVPTRREFFGDLAKVAPPPVEPAEQDEPARDSES